MEQNYDAYTAEDHQNWSILFDRQNKAVLHLAADAFRSGFLQLDLNPRRIENIPVRNTTMKQKFGWQLHPVSGLLPLDEFLNLLINKEFPVTVYMRKKEELEFSELPDIFHDLYGHAPMLASPVFSEFISRYAEIAIGYINDPEAVEYMSRFYWYTMEMGLIEEDEKLKPFGSAILTSAGEMENIVNPDVPKRPFDVEDVLNTPYDSFSLQTQYFYLHSFEQLFDALGTFRQTLQNKAFATK